MPTVINYNSARLNNIAGDPVMTVTSGPPQLLLTLGIYVSEPASYLEIMSTIGTGTPFDPTLLVGTMMVDSIVQGAAHVFIDPPDSALLSFHTILQNLPVGHHVVQLFLSTIDAEVGVDGPVILSAWVLA